MFNIIVHLFSKCVYFYKYNALKEKTKKLNELNILLNMEQKDRYIVDVQPEEIIVEEERKVEYER